MVEPTLKQAQIRPVSKTGQVGYNDIVRGLRAVGLNQNSCAIVHSSLASFGRVVGGAQTVVGALTAVCGAVLAPTFTYQTMLVPGVGPEDNGISYKDSPVSAEAEFWRPDLPAHDTIGVIPNALLHHPQAKRSSHPVLSFVGVGRGVESILATQTLDEPFAPLAWLGDNGGDVLLLGVTHRTNTMIHVGEWRAGRKPFVRWALTPERVVELAWPGDSSGFDAIADSIKHIVVRGQIGQASMQRIPAGELVRAVEDLICKDPAALLCNDPGCERCRDIRKRFQQEERNSQ